MEGFMIRTMLVKAGDRVPVRIWEHRVGVNLIRIISVPGSNSSVVVDHRLLT